MKNKKIAIFHNFMDNIGGAEIVALTLAKELNADIYTTNYDFDKIKKMGFEKIKIKSIGKVPINAPFKQQLALWRFKKLNLKKKYDFYIIAGDWAISGAVNNKPNMEYFHSPLNEIWQFKDYIKDNWLPFWKKPIFELWARYNRELYKGYFNHVGIKIANSKNVQERIKRFLHSDSKVINPPTETENFYFKKTGDYWLSVNRLFENKRVGMQIKAFSELPDERLIIVGSYEKSKHFQEYTKNLKKIKPKNVEILSWVPQEELIKLYSNCRGFITTAKDEDFGMTVIEAMASGKPVIASNEGGYKETITNKTGILINNINNEKLVEAIKKINSELKKTPDKYTSACLKQARNFDTKIFIKKIRREIFK
jgi:glycosyltransferase involved in cell wall biosynthesis